MAAYNSEWGKCITELMERHGLSLRSARAKTMGVVSHTTISDWRDGLLPKDDRLAFKFLSHFPREEAIECLHAAGISVPTEWYDEAGYVVMSVPDLGKLAIKPAPGVTELSEEEKAEVIRVVSNIIASRHPQ
jgi:hypothetical protein